MGDVHMKRVTLMFIAALFLTAPLANAAAPSPHIWSSRAQIDRVWAPERYFYHGQRPCPAKSLVCLYSSGSVPHILVDFHGGQGAVVFEIGYLSHPSDHKYWTFLTSLLPKGAQKGICK